MDEYRDLKFHPLADLFPMLDDAALDELAGDIAKHGVRKKIVLLDGEILDGRNRYVAARRAGISMTSGKFAVFEGDDPLAYVISANLFRRHLTVLQRAEVVNKIATLRRGVRPDTARAASGMTQGEAARALHVSVDSVQRARVVAERGSPELRADVEAGRIGLREAAEQVREQERGEDEPQSVRADIGGDHRTDREREERANLDRIKTLYGNLSAEQRKAFDQWRHAAPMPPNREMTVGWFRAVTDSERRDMVIEGFDTILAEAERQRCAAAIAERATPVKRGLVP